jgi:hypothetical protein
LSKGGEGKLGAEAIKHELELLDYDNPESGSTEKWIGFIGSSRGGREKVYIWARNTTSSFREVQSYCKSLYLHHKIEVQIGPAIINPLDTDGQIEIMMEFEGQPVLGIYVESKHRPFFNWKH